MDNISRIEAEVDLVSPSEIDQFQRGDHELGTSHRLNVYADEETDWTERERVEFSVKTYVYLSKLHQRTAYDRFVLVDCDGTEPLIAANLSVMAPVWIKVPLTTSSERGQSGSGLMGMAERRFSLEDLTDKHLEEQWPPAEDDWTTVIDALTRE